MRVMVEQCSSVSISNLQKSIRKLINREVTDPSEEDVLEYTIKELNKFSVDDQFFKYTNIKNVMGGYRWFFVCEKCEKRSGKLYRPPSAFKHMEQRYLCRVCHKVINESVAKAFNPTYAKVIRPLKKLRKIEAQLEKGHLSDSRIEELLDEYDAIEQKMKDTPEYRLYAFKRKRGMDPK